MALGQIPKGAAPFSTTRPIGGNMTPRAPLRLTLIGGFALRRGSQEIAVTTGGQRLIALLALRDGPIGRVPVAETLWPNCSAERSLASLRTTLWRVSQADGRVIVATPAVLGLAVGIEVDVRNVAAAAHRLNRCRGPGTIDPDAVCLADLVGELLPDWYDDWLQEEREGLRQSRLHALERLARVLSAAGRHADGIQAALAAIRLEPLRETAHRTLMELHLAEGNWSEACRQYQRCRRLLQDELGVEPSDSTRLLLGPPPRLPELAQSRLRPAPRRGLLDLSIQSDS
jgi:DNA-binding SARP family transcriptional activator